MRFNGPEDAVLRLPNTVSVSFRGIKAPCLVYNLRNDVAVSAGSACHATSETISEVLLAMKVRVAEGRWL
jgi:cysteine desulfurase